jgi:sugar transferase (PEP-CTERM/EpsH1 system associated)
MQILFVSPRQCFPAVSGAKLREYHLARGLGERSSLTYVFFREPAFDLPTQKDLPFCEEIVPVPPPRFYSPDRLIRGIVGRWPLPVLNYTSDEMKQTIQSLASKKSFNIVHFDGTHMAAYAPLVKALLPKAQVFFNWHNIESEGMQRYAELQSSWAKSLYARLTSRRLAAVERDLVVKRYGNIVCSERERKQLSALAPTARIAVVENGVDTSYFEGLKVAADPNRIVFVGLMAYHANIDAIVWFTREIWPKLRLALPGKILTIVGAKPDPAVRQLRNEPAVEVTGTVPDVRPYYSDAFAAIAPLRTGAGTRLKILEAMAAGTPVVSTSLGAEGLQVSSGKEILLAESAEEWLKAFSQLADETFRDRMIKAARELVCSRYDWKILRESLYLAYSGWLNGGVR